MRNSFSWNPIIMLMSHAFTLHQFPVFWGRKILMLTSLSSLQTFTLDAHQYWLWFYHSECNKNLLLFYPHPHGLLITNHKFPVYVPCLCHGKIHYISYIQSNWLISCLNPINLFDIWIWDLWAVSDVVCSGVHVAIHMLVYTFLLAIVERSALSRCCVHSLSVHKTCTENVHWWRGSIDTVGFSLLKFSISYHVFNNDKFWLPKWCQIKTNWHTMLWMSSWCLPVFSDTYSINNWRAIWMMMHELMVTHEIHKAPVMIWEAKQHKQSILIDPILNTDNFIQNNHNRSHKARHRNEIGGSVLEVQM